jgi:putative peptidoglycan lipid II flippase
VTEHDADPTRGKSAGDWGQPSFYGRGLLAIEPRTFTEADPVPVIAADLWEDDAGEQWSPTTYSGNRAARAEVRRLARDAPPAAHRPAPPAGLAADRTGTHGVLASSRTMAIASLASRVTGFLRSVALATALGVGFVADAYNGANSFPNMVYELLLGGVLSSVLIPLLVHAQEHDEDGGDAYTARLLSVATAALGVATLLAVAAAPLLARAFVSNPAQRDLTSIFATLLLPEIFFYGMGAIFTAVLNTRGVYGPGAWAPVLNNMITLATVGVFLALPGPKTLTPSTITTPQILVLGIGTTLGIVGQAVVLLPFLRRAGFRWRWRFRATEHDAGRLKEAGALTGWVLGYVVASQIGVTVILKVAYPHRGGVTTFTYADLLFQVPYGILGVSLLTALMPRMSRAAARGETAAVISDMSLGARLSAVALLPVTAGLIALGPTFTTVLFAHGRTSIADARHIGVVLAMASFGLFPFALVMLQLRVFYALKDARTPTLINFCMVGTKVVLVLIAAASFSGQQVIEALNVSTSLSYVVGAVVGHILLVRRIGRLGFSAVARTVVRIGVAAAFGGLAAYGVVLAVRSLLGSGRLAALAALVGGGFVGLGVVVLIASQMRLPELADIRAAVRRTPSRTAG